jgi:hypothetical protein
VHSYAPAQKSSSRFWGVLGGEDVDLCALWAVMALRAAEAVRGTGVMFNTSDCQVKKAPQRFELQTYFSDIRLKVSGKPENNLNLTSG